MLTWPVTLNHLRHPLLPAFWFTGWFLCFRIQGSRRLRVLGFGAYGSENSPPPKKLRIYIYIYIYVYATTTPN